MGKNLIDFLFNHPWVIVLILLWTLPWTSLSVVAVLLHVSVGTPTPTSNIQHPVLFSSPCCCFRFSGELLPFLRVIRFLRIVIPGK